MSQQTRYNVRFAIQSGMWVDLGVLSTIPPNLACSGITQAYQPMQWWCGERVGWPMPNIYQLDFHWGRQKPAGRWNGGLQDIATQLVHRLVVD